MKSFDDFISTKENRTQTVVVFGRECEVPAELPYYYLQKLQGLLEGIAEITVGENLELLRNTFTEDDLEYILNHPKFTPSNVFDLISLIYFSE